MKTLKKNRIKKLVSRCLKEIIPSNRIGYEGGEKVYKWFCKNTNHPYPTLTFFVMWHKRKLNLDNTDKFALDLCNDLADTVSSWKGYL